MELPVGGVVRKKNNPNSRQAEMARLSQLADLLGMDQAEIMGAQGELAEQAYKAQVQREGGEVWGVGRGGGGRARRGSWPSTGVQGPGAGREGMRSFPIDATSATDTMCPPPPSSSPWWLI